MWWSWEGDVEIDEAHPELSSVGMLLHPVPTGLRIAEIVMPDMNFAAANPEKVMLEVRLGDLDLVTRTNYPEHFEEGIAKQNYEGVARMIGFLNSPFVEAVSTRPQRHDRRHPNLGQLVRDATVAFVDLRRRDVNEAERKLGETLVQWRHRWMVSGHYRNQWYPAADSHKLIWIAPHMKGPEDKPLLPKVYQVVR